MYMYRELKGLKGQAKGATTLNVYIICIRMVGPNVQSNGPKGRTLKGDSVWGVWPTYTQGV